MNLEAFQITRLVTQLLDALTVQYVIGGSIASIFHGQARSTLDADLVADMGPHHIEEFVVELKDAFYVDE